MVCVLFSGGLDSMLLAEIAHRRNVLGSLFHVSYGQRASAQEYRAAHRYAKARELPLERVIISVRGLEAMNQKPGVSGARVVPARNLILLAHAVNHAVASGCNEIWYGACSDDRQDYADCRPSFVFDMCQITDATEGVSVVAPLLHKTKAEIISKATAFEIDLNDAWSCYAPHNDQPCGLCNSCQSVRRS